MRVPERVTDEAKVRVALRDTHGIEIGAGLGPLAGKIWRIGLMGAGATSENVQQLVTALEAEIGRFRDAIVPPVETTRDFVDLLDSGAYDHLKGRPVVTYCTGGIRCEVLSSLMAARGFGELYQLDVVDPKNGAFPMESGDVVYMERNERAFTVLGQVNAPGKFLFKDGETLRVTDALARAGGLSSKGTMRRVYLARPDADGKTQIEMFHLDDFLKFGKQESNPVVQPGDYLMFGQPKGVTLSGAIQAISGGILLNSLVGN